MADACGIHAACDGERTGRGICRLLRWRSGYSTYIRLVGLAARDQHRPIVEEGCCVLMSRDVLRSPVVEKLFVAES